MTKGGILVVDKPVGPTSHDVVGWTRRALGTKTVGHAGTLDPFASGVLVVLVGQATKLSAFATADDKRYRAEVVLGVETDTLDRDGAPVEEGPSLRPGVAEVAATLSPFEGTHLQTPPIFSAIKADGVPNYERARRGEAVVVEPREVTLRWAVVLSSVEGRVTIELEASKGFYVRSLGRDLGRALGTRAHLGALRRLRSGRYRIEDALDGEVLRRAARGDLAAQTAARAALSPITRETIPLPALEVSAIEALMLRQGKHPTSIAPNGTYVAFEGATPVAIVQASGESLRVLRGFA